MDSSPEPSPAAEAPPFPQTGRLLGIDYGSKRVGLAVCNPEQTIASPVESYTRINPQMDAKKLKQIVQDYRIAALIVGLPVHMSGDEGGKAKEARTFGDWAAKETGRPVRYFDERFTSMIADAHLLSAGLSKKKRQARIDKLAAAILLQGYLDSPHRTGEQRPPEDLRASG
jgi:putative Holliday junction resolvase